MGLIRKKEGIEHIDTNIIVRFIMGLNNVFFNKSLISEALDLYVAHPKLSFVDCYLVATTAISGEAPLWTLDHKLAAQCKVAREL